MSDDGGFGSLVLLIVAGLVFAGIGGYMWTEQNERIQRFEEIDGTVVSAAVAVDEGDADESATYYPDITYEYTVDGQTYTSSNIYPGPGQTQKSEGWARGIVEDHPEGETVTVHYDPDDPSTAFLIEKREDMFLVFAGAGGLMVLGGILGFIKGLLGLVF